MFDNSLFDTKSKTNGHVGGGDLIDKLLGLDIGSTKPEENESTGTRGTYRKDSSGSSKSSSKSKSAKEKTPEPKRRTSLKTADRRTPDGKTDSWLDDILGKSHKKEGQSSSEASDSGIGKKKQTLTDKQSSSLNGKSQHARERRRNSKKHSSLDDSHGDLESQGDKTVTRNTPPSSGRKKSDSFIHSNNKSETPKRSLTNPQYQRSSSTSSESESETEPPLRTSPSPQRKLSHEIRRESLGTLTKNHSISKPSVSSSEESDAERNSVAKHGSGSQKDRVPERKSSEKTADKKKRSLYQRQVKPRAVSFSDSQSLRSASYQEWLRKKRDVAMQKKSSKTEEEKNKEKDAEKRRKDAEMTFLRWKQNKEEQLKMQRSKEARKKLQLLEADKKEKESKESKIEESEKIFKIWKDVKGKEIKSKKGEQTRKEQKEKERKKREEEEKRRDADKIFQTWKQMKDKQIRSVVREAKNVQKTIKRQEENRRTSKEQLGEDAFQAWLEKKEEERLENIHLRSRKNSEDDMQIPWLPPNKTVPSSGKLPISSAKKRSVHK